MRLLGDEMPVVALVLPVAGVALGAALAAWPLPQRVPAGGGVVVPVPADAAGAWPLPSFALRGRLGPAGEGDSPEADLFEGEDWTPALVAGGVADAGPPTLLGLADAGASAPGGRRFRGFFRGFDGVRVAGVGEGVGAWTVESFEAGRARLSHAEEGEAWVSLPDRPATPAWAGAGGAP